MHRSAITITVPGFLATAIASTSTANFVQFVSDPYIATSGGQTYHVVDVYARFTASGDRLLNCFDVSLDLVGAGVETFYNADFLPGFPQTGQPMMVIPDANAYAFDSFVTIGSLQGDLTNGTILDPSFNDLTFVGSGLINGGGWYNVPPSNGHGDAGPDFQVLLGRFTINDEDWNHGARIAWEATVGYTPGGATTLFGTQATTFYYPPVPSTPDPQPEDIDGDGKGDLLWHNPVTGGLSKWLIDGLTCTSSGPLPAGVPANWTGVGSGDLDGDGDPDLIFKDVAGVYYAGLLQGGVLASTPAISNAVGAAWVNIAIGDINGDGRVDLVFQNSTTFEVRAWLMDGQYRWNTGSIGSSAGFTYLASADLNGDDRLDLLWRDGLGIVHIWQLDGLSIAASGPVIGAGAVGAAWSVPITGDLDNDGREDLIWRNSATGAVSGWLMNGFTRTASALIQANVPTYWALIAMEDLDNDGDDDLVWRNAADAKVNGWIMNGLVKQSGGPIKVAAPGWVNLIH